jgi:predicted nucleic acid-binding protein
MEASEPQLLILDTSVLINFLCIDRSDLLATRWASVYVTEHVADEINSHYAEQQARLREAIVRGVIVVVRLESVEELMTIDKVRHRDGLKALGLGEASAIAAAVHRGFTLGIEDRAARAQVKRLYPHLTVLQTCDLVVDMIRKSVLTVSDADKIHTEWATMHRFKIRGLITFGDLIESGDPQS